MDQTWSCPGDRELSLRAKLGTGWSYHTNRSNRKAEILSVEEQDHILDVVRRNEVLEENEKRRIGSMMEKLENMKKLVNGNGTTQCVLCGHEFRLLGASAYRCEDCKMAICSKCGVDRIGRRSNRTVWFCKICSEQREVWKRSGAWFFKTLPNYSRPSSNGSGVSNPLQASRSTSGGQTGVASPPEIAMTWTRVSRRRSSSSEGVSSEEEFSLARQANNNGNNGTTPIVTIRPSDSP